MVLFLRSANHKTTLGLTLSTKNWMAIFETKLIAMPATIYNADILYFKPSAGDFLLFIRQYTYKANK